MSGPIEQAFRLYAEAQWKRVLTQLDRDPDSPTFGCFDRDYWHYKIRDFPSAVLQQGMFTLDALRRGCLGSVPAPAAALEAWCAAAVNALARQTSASGALDEYYPNEHSYPSAAFGLYAAARMLFDWKGSAPQIARRVDTARLRRLASHVARRTERQASNQQAVGLAGLALAAAIPELGVSRSEVERHAGRFLATQHPEGWFEEYGGPDFGYLTVTLDALADYFEATGDARALAASDRAIEFLASLIGPDGELPWTLNSRNTDYVVPYGLVRRAEVSGRAAWLVETLFGSIGDPGRHFLWSTDDRYHCHYVYASVVRSLPYLERMAAASPATPARAQWLPGCGYWIRRGEGWALYVGARKGGLVRLHSTERPVRVEHGWRIRTGDGRRWTTNWWTDNNVIDAGETAVVVRGSAARLTYHTSSTLKHIALRIAAWALRRRLMPLLKRLMIFRPGASRGPEFVRSVQLADGRLRIDDEFPGLEPAGVVTRGPRQNVRHVASAGSFSPEEWAAPSPDGRRLEWPL